MENATKALLIAAAVLVAILIISLGVGVFQMAAESVSGADMDQYEVREFNYQFEQYCGEDLRGSKINALTKAVFTHNLSEKDDTKKVSITGTVVSLNTTATTAPTKVDTGKLYTATATYDSDTGLITSIAISE